MEGEGVVVRDVRPLCAHATFCVADGSDVWKMVKSDDPAVGFDNWRKAIEATDLSIPLLIENTAGGDNAMARHLDRIAGVWDAISAADGSD